MTRALQIGDKVRVDDQVGVVKGWYPREVWEGAGLHRRSRRIADVVVEFADGRKTVRPRSVIELVEPR